MQENKAQHDEINILQDNAAWFLGVMLLNILLLLLINFTYCYNMHVLLTK